MPVPSVPNLVGLGYFWSICIRKAIALRNLTWWKECVIGCCNAMISISAPTWFITTLFMASGWHSCPSTLPPMNSHPLSVMPMRYPTIFLPSWTICLLITAQTTSIRIIFCIMCVCVLTYPPAGGVVSNTKACQSLLDVHPPPRNW